MHDSRAVPGHILYVVTAEKVSPALVSVTLLRRNGLFTPNWIEVPIGPFQTDQIALCIQMLTAI